MTASFTEKSGQIAYNLDRYYERVHCCGHERDYRHFYAIYSDSDYIRFAYGYFAKDCTFRCGIAVWKRETRMFIGDFVAPIEA
jgi:hypothetical protein